MEDSTDVLAWQVATAPGGWLRFSRRRLVEGQVAECAEPQAMVYLRVGKGADGALGVREAVMIGSEPISALSWRDVPFDMARLFASGIGDQGAPPVLAAIGEQLDVAAEPFSLSNDLEALFANATTSSTLVDRGGTSTGSVSALKPPTAGLTESFLAELSAAYRELVMAKRAPAPVIAEQTGRPVGTVHRWIAEARKRGYLPPAQRGKAG